MEPFRGATQGALGYRAPRHAVHAPYRIHIPTTSRHRLFGPGETGGPRPSATNERLEANQFDLVTLSNLCVDVIVPKDTLPASMRGAPKSGTLLEYLGQNPPPEASWEVGGNTNTLIAGARLGMRTSALGHIGDDTFGEFLCKVLGGENSGICSTMLDDGLFEKQGLRNTLVCYVIVDKETNKHEFCSRYDFGPWPLFDNMTELSAGAEEALRNTSAVFVNGFVFDEVPEGLVVHAAKLSQSHGAAVLFDPGPRSWSFDDGGARRHALDTMLRIADIVLMTEEEADAVVGTEDAYEAVGRLMDRKDSNMSWCIVKMGERGALLGDRKTGQMFLQEGYKVDVEDTVGCGDSFAAAIALGFGMCRRGEADIESTLALAGAVGAATAMGEGAGRNVADISRVRGILERNGSSSKVKGALQMIDSAWQTTI